MKTSLKFFLITTLSVVLLSSCVKPSSNDGNDIVSDLAYQIKQEKLLVEIIDAENLEKCKELKEDTMQKECADSIAERINQRLFSEIVHFFDLPRCNELPVEMVKKCESVINEAGVKGPISKQEADAFHVINFNDFSSEIDCSQFKTNGLSAHCDKQLGVRSELELTTEIINSLDVGRCKEIKNKELLKMCEQSLSNLEPKN